MSQTYFSSIFASANTAVPGFGTIHSHSVGSTAHTTGRDHYFLAEGEEKPVMGHVRFSAAVAQDGSIIWRFVSADGPLARKRSWQEPQLTETTQVDFPGAVMAEMRGLSETLDERDPAGWLFSVLGAVDMERNKLIHEREELTGAIAHLTALLDNPLEPKKVFEKPEPRDPTDQERAATRLMWQQRREKAQTKLTAFDLQKSARLHLLLAMKKAIGVWCEGTLSPRPAPRAYLAEKVCEAQETMTA